MFFTRNNYFILTGLVYKNCHLIH